MIHNTTLMNISLYFNIQLKTDPFQKYELMILISKLRGNARNMPLT